MIGLIRGILIQKKPPSLLVDVNGIGYEIEAPMSTIYQLPEINQEIRLLTHLISREDATLLYGFAEENERTLFRHLIKVNGVGAKLALAILSGLSVQAFHQCIEFNDSTTLTRLPGIGKKTAERLIIEMRDRIQDLEIDIVTQNGAPHGAGPAQDHLSEAVHALEALGYNQKEATRMVSKIDTRDKNSETIIREALQTLGL